MYGNRAGAEEAFCFKSSVAMEDPCFSLSMLGHTVSGFPKQNADIIRKQLLSYSGAEKCAPKAFTTSKIGLR